MNKNTSPENPIRIGFLPVSQTSAINPGRAGGPAEMGARESTAKVIESVSVNIAEMADKISTTLIELRKGFEDSAPDTCTVKFSFGVTAEGGLVIATVEATAGIEITATWNK